MPFGNCSNPALAVAAGNRGHLLWGWPEVPVMDRDCLQVFDKPVPNNNNSGHPGPVSKPSLLPAYPNFSEHKSLLPFFLQHQTTPKPLLHKEAWLV
jgi:hypothetical protein